MNPFISMGRLTNVPNISFNFFSFFYFNLIILIGFLKKWQKSLVGGKETKLKFSSSNLVGLNILKFDNNFNVKKVLLIVSILSKMQLMCIVGEQMIRSVIR